MLTLKTKHKIFFPFIMMMVILGLVASANANSYTHYAGAKYQSKNGDLNTVNKYEKHIDLQPGEFKTDVVHCAPGEQVVDGSGRIDHVDQGTGYLDDVKIVGSYALSSSSWEVTFKNNASGRAQAKIFIVCVKSKTIGHNFDLDSFYGPSTPNHWNPGDRYVVLECPVGYVPITPGYYRHSGDADIFYSEPEGTRKWKLGFRVYQPNTHINTQIRCLKTTVGQIAGKTHKLVLKHRVINVTVPPKSVKTYVVSCGDLSKGIVATYHLGKWLKLLGHDPQPKSRVFTLYNPTNHHRNAKLDLICLGNRTGHK